MGSQRVRNDLATKLNNLPIEIYSLNIWVFADGKLQFGADTNSMGQPGYSLCLSSPVFTIFTPVSQPPSACEHTYNSVMEGGDGRDECHPAHPPTPPSHSWKLCAENSAQISRDTRTGAHCLLPACDLPIISRKVE